ncbi:MAG: DUF881 domain-containing protein [Clostridia bacterium]|nr:DUF881 domain-containing protein [Clostridia bacterium]MDD4798024.1 DUF881 domain-containing protein [Clostridia bacterium]
MKQPVLTTKIKKWQIPLFIVLLIFGFVLVAQYRTHLAVQNNLESLSISELTELVISLNEREAALSAEQETMQAALDSINERINTGISMAATTQNQLNTMEMITGKVPVQGPGISITITGESYLIYHDLIMLVNELFVTGAEVVCINDVRITHKTAINEAIDEFGHRDITIDGKVLLLPIIIKAIGNPDTLEKGLTFTGGIINKFNTIYQVFPIVKKEANLIIPAAKNAPSLYLKSVVKDSTKKNKEEE